MSAWTPEAPLSVHDAPLVATSVRQRFERFVTCHSSFKSLIPDADAFFARSALPHVRALERALACLTEAPGTRTLAADYAKHARILYEWEGLSSSPLVEAAYAETHIAQHPGSPLLPYLYFFVAERSRYGFELLDGEKDPAGMAAASARYSTFIERARAADPMVRLVADDFDGLSFVYRNIGKHPRDARSPTPQPTAQALHR